MKTIAIISALCLMFITISGFKGDTEAVNTHAQAVSSKTAQCSHDSNIKQPFTAKSKKMKARQIPNWQRVIPGMFR